MIVVGCYMVELFECFECGGDVWVDFLFLCIVVCDVVV